MFNIDVTDADLKFATEQVSKKNFGRRHSFNGNTNQQLAGILSETILYRILLNKYPDYDKFNVVDININNKSIDVKTMRRRVFMQDHYAHNFVAYQKDFKVDILLFTSLNYSEHILQVCGWLPKDKFLEKAKYFKMGELRYRDDGTSFPTRAPLFEITQQELNPIDNLDDLKNL